MFNKLGNPLCKFFAIRTAGAQFSSGVFGGGVSNIVLQFINQGRNEIMRHFRVMLDRKDMITQCEPRVFAPLRRRNSASAAGQLRNLFNMRSVKINFPHLIPPRKWFNAPGAQNTVTPSLRISQQGSAQSNSNRLMAKACTPNMGIWFTWISWIRDNNLLIQSALSPIDAGLPVIINPSNSLIFRREIAILDRKDNCFPFWAHELDEIGELLTIFGVTLRKSRFRPYSSSK